MAPLLGTVSEVSRVDVPSEFSSVTLADEASELQIENIILQTPQFRKLHLEVARSDAGLQVVHCVMFPRAEFDLPLFSLDMVGFGDRITLLILDLCPVTPDLSLPAAYGPSLESLQRELLAEVPRRGTPDWGKAIFSEHCMLLSPSTSEHVANFIEYVRATLAMHLQHSLSSQPDKELRAQNCAGQKRFCEFQLKNDKTRRILAKSKGEDWANRYMDDILFDMHNIQ
ncbi:hypothetical protein CYMTET_47565 [Cymbomonas tetramitiformis]|uniref:Phycocyanobilin:ferredoxin oxidoreductase n=1 Tax=Cymbomonas tetramitiformis TaxID=36881 RepID=A0AAE0BVC3_9CHLO|nr:hypothetical protein CYMTET_47565 [Cymbomonas tetramitiformis]